MIEMTKEITKYRKKISTYNNNTFSLLVHYDALGLLLKKYDLNMFTN